MEPSSGYGEAPATNALTSAIGWIEGLLIGPLATSIAVLAVAAVGFAMLTGRIDLRRAASVVLGCFLLFGAPLIAIALRGAIEPTAIVLTAGAAPSISNDSPHLPAYRARPPDPFDPYAGVPVANH